MWSLLDNNNNNIFVQSSLVKNVQYLYHKHLKTWTKHKKLFSDTGQEAEKYCDSGGKVTKSKVANQTSFTDALAFCLG